MSASSSLWGGLDAGADHSRLCLIDDQLSPVADVTLASDADAIVRVLASHEHSRIENIAIETTAAAAHMVRGLRDSGYRVTLYQAGQVSRYLRMRRNKTDNNDARGLAELAKLRLPSMRGVHLKSPEIQRWRSKLQMRHRITFQRVACEGMIRSLIRLHGGRLKPSSSASVLQRNVAEAIEQIKEAAGVDLAPDLAPLITLAIEMRRYLDSVDDEIARWAEAHPICSRFLAVPGVGPLCAVSFYTAVEDADRFSRAADVGPYLGLTPKVMQSGGSLRHGRISKLGNQLTRTHLFNAASVIFMGRVKDQPLKRWGQGIAERAGGRKARVALARRLAVIMLAMWKSGTDYQADLPAPREAVDTASAALP